MNERSFLEVMEEGERLAPSLASRGKAIANFQEKFVSFLELITNKKGHGRNTREYLMKEAVTTTDFPILFGTVLERSLLGNYAIAKPDWRSYVKVGTQNDFRLNDLVGIYGLQSQLDLVPERGEYKQKVLGEGKIQNRLYKYGRAFSASWEAFINDNLGALNDLSQRLTNAALRTEFMQVTKLFVASTGPITTLFGTSLTHPIDAITINNKGTLPFTAENLGITISAMQNQLDVDGEPIVFDGFELVFGPSLQIRVLQALNPASLISIGGGAAAAVQTSANVFASLNVTPHMNPYLRAVDVSANKEYTWYVFGRLSNGAAVQMNFLTGHEAPEVVQKASDKISPGGGVQSAQDGDFETDTFKMRVRHIMGGSPVDPRLAYAQVSAT